MKFIRCQKCGQQFNPSTQFAACRGRGDPLKHQSCIEVPSLALLSYEPVAKKPQRQPFQSDFQLLWDERQTQLRIRS